jgi:hypothetical protein
MVHETTLEQAMAEKPIAAVIRRASRQRRWPAMPASACLSLPILVRAMTPKAVCACWRSVGTFSRTLLAEDFMVYSLS